jgi:hypothetical protein
LLLYVARDFETRKEAIYSGTVAGTIALVPALMFQLAFAAASPDVLDQAIPVYWMIEQLGFRSFLVNMASVHYFTDYIESIRLGEQIACGILEEQAVCFPEDFQMTFSAVDRAPNGDPIDITIEKTGDTVVKHRQVRTTPAPASPATILTIAAE